MKSKKQSSFNQNEAVKSVLVGTFRNENAEWIKEKKLYNLPLPQCGKVAFHENIEVPFKALEKRPPLVDKNDVLKSIKFDESWIEVVK